MLQKTLMQLSADLIKSCVQRIRSLSVIALTVLVVFILVSPFLLARPALAYDAGQLLISRSTFVRLAFTDTRELDPYNFAYFPAGTWLKYLGKELDEFSKKRLLVLSETGALGYIREDQLWDRTGLEELSKSGSLGIFKRKYTHEGGVKNKFDFNIFFTRGERYEVIDRTVDGWIVNVDINQKFLDEGGKPVLALKPGTAVVLKVTVPEEHLKVIDFKNLDAITPPANETIGFPEPFEKSIIDGVAGIEKPCNTKKVKQIRSTVGGGFSLEKFFAAIKLSAERETEEIEELPETKNVTRTYYTQGDLKVYRLTQYKDCQNNHYEFSFLKPGNEEVSVTKDWAKQNSLKTDTATGKILVSCPQQYFTFQDALIEQGFDEEESSFVISKIGRWKGLSDERCS